MRVSGKNGFIAVFFFSTLLFCLLAHTSFAFTNTWTCTSGLTCDYQCNTNPYQKMWDGAAATSEYSYSFTASQATKYTCTVTVRTSSFGNSETNEVTDVYINDNPIGSTTDECCPEDCGSETLPNPIIFTLEQGFYDTGGGGVFVHDVDSDGLFDFVFTSEQSNNVGWLQVYDHWGSKLWSKTGVKTFMYLHHPSAIAGDMDGDGKEEIAYLKKTSDPKVDNIVIVDAATGVQEKTVSTGSSLNDQPVAGMGIVNLRGAGDRDVVVQYKRSGHYDNDHLKAINLETGAVLWTNNNFIGTEHNIFRQADLDGDGKDDIAGAILLNENGNKMHSWNPSDIGVKVYGLDSMVIADVYYPGVPYPNAPCEGICIPDTWDCIYYDDCSDSSDTCPSGEHCCVGACTEPVYNPPSVPEIISAPTECDLGDENCGPFRVRSMIVDPRPEDYINFYMCSNDHPDWYGNCGSTLDQYEPNEIADLYRRFLFSAQHNFLVRFFASSYGGDSAKTNSIQVKVLDSPGNTRPTKPEFQDPAPTTCTKGQQCGPFRVKSTDSDGDSIAYVWIWDDGDWNWEPGYPPYPTTAHIPSGSVRNKNHNFQEPGTYNVKIKAVDRHDPISINGYTRYLCTYSGVLSHTVTVTDSGAAGESEVETDKVSFVSATNPLEVILAETAGPDSRTIVVNKDRIVMAPLNPWDWEDPDKVAVGNFRTGRAGLEIFCRSSASDGTCPRPQVDQYEECPWVHDAQGAVINKYYLYDSPGRPAWWTTRGAEEIVRIDWDGNAREEIVGKERHEYGGIAILDAPTGTFEKAVNMEAMRVYAADILGDYREEVIVVDWNGGQGNKVKIFWNDQPNTNTKPRYWTLQHYRRQKQNWNYYSP